MSSDIIEVKEVQRVSKALRERLDTHDNNRKEVQERFHNICNEWRRQIDMLEDCISSELETKFKEEDNHLQSTLSELQTAGKGSLEEVLQRQKQNSLLCRSTDSKTRPSAP